ncbi:hypothetical protein [Pseudarthrobacter sp. S9]|uniref:hypothetical protein n=1 Tax=Pseudarthrobacter sp. S9 TaxID=3418421 RepID=UPI003D087FBA
MTEMHIKEQWDRLSPATRQWFIDNPGCVIVPRTITAAINTETGENAETDAHGETILSEEDRAFIQAKSHDSGTTANPTGHQFFDAVQPGQP